jgi:hypothetical protein
MRSFFDIADYGSDGVGATQFDMTSRGAINYAPTRLL